MAVLSPAHAAALEAILRQRYGRRTESRKAEAREGLLSFCEYTYPGYQRAPHLELVASALEEIERGGNDRLIIEMPPRH